MNLSTLVNNLTALLEEHGDMPILRKDLYNSYDDPRYHQYVDVNVYPIHADRDWEEQEESADNDLCDTQDTLKNLLDDFDPDDYETDQERREALQEVADAGAAVKAAEAEHDRVLALDKSMTHYVIDA